MDNSKEQLAFATATGAPSPEQWQADKQAEREQAAAHFRALHVAEKNAAHAARKVTATPATPAVVVRVLDTDTSDVPVIWYEGPKYDAWVHETALDLFRDARSVTADDGHALEVADQAAITVTQDEREMQDVRDALDGIVEAREGAD